jgi:TRAP-type mannitol/chloroaromatic compound transport system permease small subunit
MNAAVHIQIGMRYTRVWRRANTWKEIFLLNFDFPFIVIFIFNLLKIKMEILIS